MTARPERPYPPDFGSAATMAYLYDVSESTWWKWWANGTVPAGTMIEGSRRWSRHEVAEWIAARGRPAEEKGSEDPIMEAVRGKKARTRRAAA